MEKCNLLTCPALILYFGLLFSNDLREDNNALKRSWRRRVDESSSSSEARKSIERKESREKVRRVRNAETGVAVSLLFFTMAR